MKLSKKSEKLHLDAQNQMSRMTAYYYWAVSFLGSNPGSNIWDAGAGIGILADKLSSKERKLLLTEFGEENLNILNQKYEKDSNVTVAFCDLTEAKAHDFKNYAIDTIIQLDVLEHLEDDQAVLNLFYEVLPRGGKILIKVPAHPGLFCEIDKASLHYRRYTKNALKQKVEKSGFKIQKISYMNMLGAILYFIKGKIGKKKTNFSNTFSARKIKRMNKIIPVLVKIEKILPPFFGLSVIVVAEK